ncbi:MAG: Spore germination protein GerKA [Clostridia bacterium]|jgi:spore germination protein KA|nr:Spore germination protein GerKA [Clostridia bacterium]
MLKKSLSKKERDVIFNETFDYENLEINSANIQSILGTNADFIYRQLFIHNNRDIEVSVFYIDGMINSQLASDYVIKPLMQAEPFKACSSEADAIRIIDEGTVYFSDVKKRANINDVLSDILTGSVAVIFNKHKIAFTFETKGFDKRPVGEPVSENVAKGAKDSFNETIRVNTATCRRKIKSPNLVIEQTIIGTQTKTPIALCYMKNIANDNLVQDVKKKLDNIDVDNLLSSGFLEGFLIDKSSIFPQMQYTERPDKFCVNLLEGRVGIIIDGLPIAYIVPGTLLQFVQAPEDYSQHFIISSSIRYLRFTSMFISLLLPAFYISITTFNQEMIPTELTFSIVAAKQGVPFPMFVEVLLMLIAFELLVEAGLRLPQTIGQTVSIVGALVVGQAAVEAKLLSPATVIIVATTAITSFTMPSQDLSNALRIWRFVLAVAASIIGMYGLTMGLFILIYEWCKIDTFGVPYLSPFIGDEEIQLQDSLFRLPLSAMKKRPNSLNVKNKQRQK